MDLPYLKKMFEESDGSFSWRKVLTAQAGLMFVVSCIVNLWLGRVLDSQYLMIIAGVFTFYFFKDRMSGQSKVALESVKSTPTIQDVIGSIPGQNPPSQDGNTANTQK